MSRSLHTRTRRALATAALSALALAALGASSASAYLPGAGTGTAGGKVTTLGAPTISSASAGTGTVTLSWGAVTAPGSGTVSYYVRRDGGEAAGNCPSVTSASSVTSCTDSGLNPGEHAYSVTAVWRSWTRHGGESKVTVSVGVAAQLALSAASTSPTAGSADNLTITAEDSAGHTVTSYTGSKTLTFGGASTIGSSHPSVTNSSGTAVAFGTGETISFTNGVAAVTSGRNGAMTLYKAETANVTVSDGTLSNGAGTAFVVGPSSTSVFSLPTPATQTAGVSFNETISAYDQYGNATPAYTGSQTISFSGPSSSPGGKAPSYPSKVTFTSGVGTAALTLYDAQSTTLTAKQSFSVSGTSASFTVVPAPTAAISVASPGSQTAGVAFNATLSAIDAYGNVQPSYEGTHSIAFSGPASSPSGKAPSYPESVSFSEGTGAAQVTLYDAQTTTVKASDGTFSGTSSSFTVNPASAASFSLSTPAPTAGTAFTETITAKDTYGNTATSYTGNKAITFSGPANSPKNEAPKYPTGSVVFTSGVSTSNNAITIYDAGATTLTATQGTVTGTSAPFTVGAAAASVFAWAPIATQTAGATFTATLTADDAYGNLAAYEGTKTIAFSGPSSSPKNEAPKYPSSVTFTAGVGNAAITLYSAGSGVAITATQGTVKGTSAAFAVNPASAGALSLASPGERTAGSAFGETITAIDAYGNTASGYEGTKTIAFSGPSAAPSGTAPSYPASVSFAAGVATAQITLYDAQTTSLKASEGALTGTSASFSIGPASAAALSLSTPSPTAGTPFTETITAKDGYGNTATGYGGTKTLAFSGPGSSPKGEAPKYPSTVSFSSGVATPSITIYGAGSTTLSAKEGTIAGTSASFTVSPGTPVLSFAPIATQTAGAAFNVTLTAADAYGNAVGWEGTKTITFSGPAPSPSEKAPSYPASVLFAAGQGTASVTLYDATTATSIEASEASGAKGTSASFAVSAAGAARTAWTGASSSAGSAEGLCLFTCVWSGFSKNRSWSSHVSVTDEYGNIVSNVGSAHNVTLTMTESASTGTLSTKSLTMPSTGTATTSSSVTYSSPNSNTWSSDSFTAQAAGFTTAGATVKK